MSYGRRKFALLTALAPLCLFKVARAQENQDKTCARPPDAPTSAISLDSEVYKALTRLEARLDCELNNMTVALNNLPQRLLTEEAKKEIKESLRGDLSKEFQQHLDTLKQELQKQIEDWKRGSGSH